VNGRRGSFGGGWSRGAVGEGEGGRVALAVTVAASAVVVRRRRRRRRRGRKSGGFGGSEVRETERDIVERERETEGSEPRRE
jgi:hypothetical protein